jgi:hypothetical protein
MSLENSEIFNPLLMNIKHHLERKVKKLKVCTTSHVRNASLKHKTFTKHVQNYFSTFGGEIKF